MLNRIRKLMRQVFSADKIHIYYRNKGELLRLGEKDAEEKIKSIKGIVGQAFMTGKQDITFKSEADERFNPLFDIETSHALLTVPVVWEGETLAVFQMEYRQTVSKGISVSFESVNPVDKNLVEIFTRNLAVRLADL